MSNGQQGNDDIAQVTKILDEVKLDEVKLVKAESDEAESDEAESDEAESDEKTKFYGVANGRQIGVTNKWSVTQKRTNGYPANAQEKFKTWKEAETSIIKYEEEKINANKYYYDLAVGRKVGVFECWEDMKPFFTEYVKARYRRVSTTSDGEIYIQSMARNKFTYFKKKTFKRKRDHNEVCSMFFALAGQDYKDVKVVFPNWPTLQPTIPVGKLPLIEEVLAQSVNTIARYLAKNSGFAGKNAGEEAQVKSLVAQIVAFRKKLQNFFIAAFVSLPGEDIEKLKTEVLIPGVNKHLPLFHNLLKKSSSGFLVGNSVTYVDLGLAGFVNAIQKKAPEVLKDFQKIKDHSEKILATLNYKAWVFYFLFAF